MSLKWSTIKVSGAMDEVEHQVCLADSFITEAKAKAEEARNIANLPGYMDTRLIRLICQLERIEDVKSAIKAIRDDIPDGAIETEQERTRHGSTQSLI